MENRERDKKAGDVNRKMSSQIGKNKSDSSAGYESSSSPNRKPSGSESWDSKSKNESSSGSRH